MKAIFKTSMAACCAALALAACSDDEKFHNEPPRFTSGIVLDADKDQVRPGQTLTASVAVPTGGENIRSVTYAWKTSNIEFQSNRIEGGVAYYSFKALTTPGSYTLTFKADWTYNAAQGSDDLFGGAETSLAYTVVKCDILNSFWSDNLATTLKVNPNLQEASGLAGTYGGRFSDALSANSSAMIDRAYTFTGDVLSKITENAISSAGHSQELGLWRRLAQRRLGMTVVADYYIDRSTTPARIVEIAESDWEDTAWRTEMNQKLQDDIYTLYSELKSGTTHMKLSAFAVGDGSSVYLMRTYTPLAAE